MNQRQKQERGKAGQKTGSRHHRHDEGESTAPAIRLKRKMQKALALVDYYNGISEKGVSGEEELKDARSKMEFTQKEILRLCLEGKRIIKDAEAKKQGS